MFQSPSLRGSGRFESLARNRASEAQLVSIPFIAGQWSLLVVDEGRFARVAPRFNPLHCGAVVASTSASQRAAPGGSFQSPSLRGSGRFWIRGVRHARHGESFNPLHCGAVVASSCRLSMVQTTSCFNPLHCGAVVASTERLPPRRGGEPCFNPLHCGAVVASRPDGTAALSGSGFQSPSLRGSGRFRTSWKPWPETGPSFNPLHCGAVVASA